MVVKKPHAFYARAATNGTMLLVLEYEVELEEKDMTPLENDMKKAVKKINTLMAAKKSAEEKLAIANGQIQTFQGQIEYLQNQLADFQSRAPDASVASELSAAVADVEDDLAPTASASPPSEHKPAAASSGEKGVTNTLVLK